MSREEVEEYFSEDLGFRLRTNKLGVSLFSSPIDFDIPVVAEKPLQLLHVAHKKQLFAASNTQSIGIGRLADLDDEAALKANFVAVSLKNVTHVRFDAANKHLYVISDGEMRRAAVDDYLKAPTSESFVSLGSGADVVAFEPSPAHASTYAYLDASQRLHIVHKNAQNEICGVTGFSWARDGSELIYVSENSLHFLSLDNVKTASYRVQDAGKLFSVHAINNSHWYVVGKSEDGEDDVHTLVAKIGTEFSSLELMLPPAFGDVSRAPTVYFASISGWIDGTVLSFLASGLSTEVATLECGAHTRLVAVSNDTDRAELPMDEDSEDTLPVGFAMELSGTARTVTDASPLIESAVGVLPRLLCVNNKGALFIWDIFDVAGVRENKLNLKQALASLPEVELDAVVAVENTHLRNVPASSITSTGFAKTLGSEHAKSKFGQASTLSSQSHPSTQPQPGAFGATSFGAVNTAKPMFGSGDFKAGPKPDAKPETTHSSQAKPAFGGSGFGSSAASSTGFGGSGFGAAAKSGFGSSSAGFGSNAVFGQASFDTKQPEKPFGTTPSSSGQTQASGYSGFGTNSKFGASPQTAQSTNSPFAKLSDEKGSSPFANLMKSEKASPFGAANNAQDSPVFGGSKKDDMASPFASLKTENKASPFGGSSGGTPSSLTGSNNATSSPFAGLESKKASPFASVAQDSTSSPFGRPFGTSNVSNENQNSVEAQFSSSESDADSETESSEESEASNSGNESEVFAEKSTFANMNLNKSATASQGTGFGQFNPSSGPKIAPVSKDTRLGDLFGGFSAAKEPAAKSSGISVPQQSSTSYESSRAATPGLNDSSLGLSKPAKVSEMSTKNDSDNVKPVPVSSASHVSKNSESVKETHNTIEKPTHAKPEPSHQESELKPTYDGQDIGEIVKKTEFLKLCGFSEESDPKSDEVQRKFTELIQYAQGHMDILALNTEKAQVMIDAAGLHRKQLTGSDLATPASWTLGDLADLASLASTPRERLSEALTSARHQNTKLAALLERVNTCEQKKTELQQIITQIALHKQSVESAKLETRPLDVRAEMLRHKLRQKVAKVESLQEEIAQKILPFGVRLDLGHGNTERVEKLEKVVREVSLKARETARQVDSLEQEVHRICANGGSEDGKEPLSITGSSSAKRDQFAIAAKYASAPVARKITPTPI
ncbi:hypothetical protein OXX59_006191 [Metschnikowia pulcherrima]